MISTFVGQVFNVLTGNYMTTVLQYITHSIFSIDVGGSDVICAIFVITFICFLFRIIYKFKCALFGKKKRKKER